jgi:hypothetical protein
MGESLSGWASEVINSLGTVVLPNRLTAAVYHRFLVNDLTVLMENLPHHQRQHTWFMHDGALPRVLCIVRRYLNETFCEPWVERRGPVNCLHDPLTLILWAFGCRDT